MTLTKTLGGGGGGGSLTVKDEGSTLTSSATSIDVVGSAVAATNVSGAVTLTHYNGVTPDTQPVSPNAADDEWEAGALDTGGTRRSGATAWAWQNQGTATAGHSRGAVNLLAVAGGGGTMNARYILQTLPAGDWTYEALLFVDGGDG